jgi:small subunit ribosomal protein S2
MAVVSMKALLETGVHFGHRTRKWNPRMKPYIFTERNGIHIIDLQQTLEALSNAYSLVRDTVADGGKVLFVGTKRQAQETIELEARRCGMPYVNARWLGGTLTNWRTIRSQIDELQKLERRRDAGEFELLTKKEALSLTRRIDKLEGRLGGIREMASLPNLLFVVDVRREDTAIHEANLLNIPVLALVDTNCDPRYVDFVIPSNDDAIRAIKLMVAKIADAIVEGKALRKDVEEEEPGELEDAEALAEADMADEDLLGEATLAKLKSGEFDERDIPRELLEAVEVLEAGAEEETKEAELAEVDAEGETEEAAVEGETEEAAVEGETEEATVEDEPAEEEADETVTEASQEEDSAAAEATEQDSGDEE